MPARDGGEYSRHLGADDAALVGGDASEVDRLRAVGLHPAQVGGGVERRRRV